MGSKISSETANSLVIFLLAIAVIQETFSTEYNCSFISDCMKNHSTTNKKNLISEQIVIFYSPSNALCSSNESVQIKHFKHHTFIIMCSLFT